MRWLTSCIGATLGHMGGEASVWRWLVQGEAGVRRVLLGVVAFSICVAAITAILAVLGDSFDRDAWRVVGTSLGFGIFSSTATAGAALARDRPGPAAMLAAGTMGLSALSFALLAAALWLDIGPHLDDFGACALVTLAAAHASIVTRAARASDGATVRALSATSIALGVLDGGTGALILADALDIHDVNGFERASAVTLIALIATTALPPVLRRMRAAGGPRPVPPPPAPHDVRRGGLAVAASVIAVAAIGAYSVGRISQAASVRLVTQFVRQPISPTPAPTSPPASTASRTARPSSYPPAKPIALHHDIIPTKPFSCPEMGGGPPQGSTGPSRHTDFESASVAVGPRGVCVVMRKVGIAAAAQRSPVLSNVATVTFERPGHVHYDIKLFARPYAAAYWMDPWPGDSTSIPARVGALGVDDWTISLLVTDPKLPSWILDGGASWDVHSY